MKKTFTSMVAALLVFLASAPLAHAAATPYVSLSAGVGFLADSDAEVDDEEFEDVIEYKTGFAVNGAVGLDGDMYRVEGALGYQANDWDAFIGFDLDDDAEAETSILSFMVNGYLDIEMPAAPVTPYLMAGAGVANVDLDIEGESDDDTVFAYQIGAGVGFEVSPNVTVDIGYRYFATSDVNFEEFFDDDADFSVASHNIMAGVRVGL